MSSRIRPVDIVLRGKAVTIISVCGPQSGRNGERKAFMMILWLKCNQEKGTVLSWEISMITLEALLMDIMELTVTLDGENVTEMVKGS